MYRCPKCKEALVRSDRTYRCAQTHSFDIARQGYVNLLLGNKKMTGDNQEMVHARTAFLHHGYYAFLQQRICQLIDELHPSVLIDAGCGEGYYTNELKRQLPMCEIYGFDLSKFALKQAAKAHPEVAYAVASVADLPMCDACSDVVLSIFAPIYPEEVYRILRTQGYFVKVAPGPSHLWGMKEILYKTVYENESDHAEYSDMNLIHEELLEKTVTIQGSDDIQALFSMTPYAYRSPRDTSEQLKNMDTLQTQLQFHIQIWQKQ